MARTTRSKARSSTRSAENAITILTADHKKVSKIFAQYEKVKDNDLEQKQQLAKMACDELTIHAQVEEETFYPASARRAWRRR